MTVRLVSQDEALDTRMGSFLAPFTQTTGPARLRHTFQVTHRPEEGLRAFNDCRRLTSTDDFDQNLAALVAGMNHVVIEGLNRFAVHAGVVQIGERVVAFPAESGAGKTTLTAACLLSGFGYLSDEALILDDDGTVVPYPKPLALTPWSCETLGLATDHGETLLTATELDSSVGSGGTVVSDIVVAVHGATRETLVEMPRSRGVTTLLSHSFNHYKDPARAFRLATGTAAGARMWRLEHDHPMRAAELLREKLG